jgi:hypothetical protein
MSHEIKLNGFWYKPDEKIANMTLEQCLDLAENAIAWDERGDSITTLNDCINRIRELTRWIPVGERLPTIEDADARGLVEWKHNVFYGGTEIRQFDQPTHYHERLWYTHWRKIDAPNLG